MRVITESLREVHANYEEDDATYADDTCAILKALFMRKLRIIGNKLVNNFRQGCQVAKLEVSGTETEEIILKFREQDKNLNSKEHREKSEGSQDGRVRSNSDKRFRKARWAQNTRKRILVTNQTPIIRLPNTKIRTISRHPLRGKNEHHSSLPIPARED